MRHCCKFRMKIKFIKIHNFKFQIKVLYLNKIKQTDIFQNILAENKFIIKKKNVFIYQLYQFIILFVFNILYLYIYFCNFKLYIELQFLLYIFFKKNYKKQFRNINIYIFIIINIQYVKQRRINYRLKRSSRILNRCSIKVRRRKVAFNERKQTIQVIYTNIKKQINKQIQDKNSKNKKKKQIKKINKHKHLSLFKIRVQIFKHKHYRMKIQEKNVFYKKQKKIENLQWSIHKINLQFLIRMIRINQQNKHIDQQIKVNYNKQKKKRHKQVIKMKRVHQIKVVFYKIKNLQNQCKFNFIKIKIKMRIINKNKQKQQTKNLLNQQRKIIL
ncbi:hypothetical protein IMG5_000650 [Ichthyophthirius multifiliis]|uniref:Transmembrane protein n=1 Tax=Ichthyophthirius multifiliis TaxID=5932 RepID=G0QIV2_ICHMU|nr:hypothetical protein IMG5_000650 [Ichthyophthirius multifiliis]EGR34837.1 hypothetical protein IMG5_000650 [Ichthyophthirius multifiliis]|eukprot:XP_004040141.1 hypothetical protein IMG5_000650 [Ichthyophthirius multifiliis]